MQLNLPDNVRELTIPSTLAEWTQRRGDLRSTLLRLLGNIPAITVPKLLTTSTENRGDYKLQRFEFDNGAGEIVPGYLLIPNNGAGKHPAIYYCHWHGDEYGLGKNELFSSDHTPEIPGERLCRDGYIVMATDAYCFGERSGKGPGGPDERGTVEEMSTSKRELWLGRSLWAMIVRDDLMAINALLDIDAVDASRVAVTGISMGATRSWWVAALNERIKTGVAVACLTRYQNLLAEQKLKYHGIYYYVPGILREFDAEAIISLIAPRPFLFMTGDQDSGSPISGIVEIERVVRKVYSLYGTEHNFENLVFNGVAHEYTEEMWARMRRWMSRFLLTTK